MLVFRGIIMQFTELSFLFIFLPILIILYYLIKVSQRPVVLLVFSLVFYACGSSAYLISLCMFVILDYGIVRLLEWLEIKKKNGIRKIIFVSSLILNLLPLLYYKYANFIIKSSNALLGRKFETKDLLIPLGISFFTFKAISFIADVYKKKITKINFVDMATYLTFFAHIQSGPIERFYDFIEGGRAYSQEIFSRGCVRFMIGLGKKVVIADVLSKITNEVFDSVTDWSTSIAWLGAICYSLQLYYDFSGYTDMAIGIGNMLGIECPENFEYPYISKSVTEFWRRWHISLGSWFRDYVYIPLGGSRVGKLRLSINLFVVWILTGLWHGAGWQFIMWGLLYFAAIFIEKLLKIPDRFKSTSIKAVYRFLVLLFINFQWVLFRSTSLKNGLRFIKRMIIIKNDNISASRAIFLIKDYWLFVLMAMLFAVPIYPYMEKKFENNKYLKKTYGIISGLVILGAFTLAISFIISGQNNPFLYGNF